MIKTITFGYRWEGLALHQWAFTHANLLAVVVPENRSKWADIIFEWTTSVKVKLLIQDGSDDLLIVKTLKEYKPDIILCHCYTYKLTPGILTIPKLGCINIHPGALPQYKGGRPIEDAMASKDEWLRVALHYMNEEFDAGEVIIDSEVKRDENLQRMRMKLTEEGLRLLGRFWSGITK